ncbi:unnamed protein product [Caenorhabditis angaria]|uniref:TOG domain-containing protein n=1 Tax=Caenorhabditis angaria TaxID=860376 RepID=A0A9P1N5K8_9PELO|nr:unnamed protein product [Caenorhabditis angaria]
MASLFDALTKNADRLPTPNFLPEDFLDLLRSPDFDTRLQTLNRASGISKRDPDWFTRFPKKGELFKCLDKILIDERWELQHQCIKFLAEAMPTFGTSTEYCMCYVMPNLIPKMGSPRITVKKVCQQAIITFLRLKPEALQSFLKMLGNYVQNNPNDLQILKELPAFFIPELSKLNWTALVEMYANQEATKDNGLILKKLSEYIGVDTYNSIVSSMSPEKRENISKMTENVKVENTNDQNRSINRASIKLVSGNERRLRFGIVPALVASLISDDQDINSRISGLEKLKQIIEQITPEEINRLVPHLHSYLLLLSNVLSDLNFKIVVIALDIVRLTVHSLRNHMEAHLQQLVSLVSKHFGNQKSVIKQLIMMTFMDLFQHINPKSVSASLRPYLENKNSRTREEVLNILTAALMTISPSKFNMTPVINNLIPLLNDVKRRVRLAAFEQLSVVAYLMNNKYEPIMKIVREIEVEQSARGLSEAVQSRIRRQLLPRIRYDGLIEYSTPPISDTAFAVDENEMANPENADLTWILNSGGREIDPFDRTVSPVSLAGNLAVIRRNRLNQQQQQLQSSLSGNGYGSHEINNGQKMAGGEGGAAMTMARMKSDDSIVRRQTSAISNPNSSTSSWEHPKKRENSPMEKAAVIPKKEVNNNLVAIEQKYKKSRSETNLSNDERENLTPPPIATSASTHSPPPPHPPTQLDHPRSFDDRPAKASGQYSLQDFESVGNNMGKKSISHHSLPITTNNHQPLKNTQSQPPKRGNSFLKSGQGQRTTKAAKPREVSAKSYSMDMSMMTVNGALKKLESDEWSDKVEGLNMISALSETNSRQIQDNLKDVIIAVLNECKNLRSSVSRVAIVTIGTVAQNLNSKIDSEMEKICAVLLNKAGDVSNAFIREDATDSLNKLVQSATAGKALQGIITAGSKSKNNTIRASCASFVNDIISIQGSSTIMNNPSTLSTVLPILIMFCKDQTPQVRQYGKQALLFLAKDTNFERLLRKNAGESEGKVIREILSGIEKRGNESMSGTLSRVGSTRKVQKKLPDSLQLDLDEIRTELLASGWERRQSGLQRFEEMCSHAAKAVASDTRLIEAFIARIGDLNTKVASYAMDTYLVTLATMSKLYSTESNLKAVLNQLLFALTAHLSSKSEEHRHLAQTCIQHTIKTIDSVCLLPAMTAATRKSNVKQRPFILGQFTELCKLAYRVKPKQVEVMALPLLWEYLKSPPSDVENKKALEKFVKTLSALISEKSLLDLATSELDPQKKKHLELLIR